MDIDVDLGRFGHCMHLGPDSQQSTGLPWLSPWPSPSLSPSLSAPAQPSPVLRSESPVARGIRQVRIRGADQLPVLHLQQTPYNWSMDVRRFIVASSCFGLGSQDGHFPSFWLLLQLGRQARWLQGSQHPDNANPSCRMQTCLW